MSAYSMPLCTIFTKCPAPPGPPWVTHGPAAVFAAIASRAGERCRQDSAEPPGIREGPRRAPSSPPETPMPTKCSPLAASSFSRRSVSSKRLFPPSITTSPASRVGTSRSSTMSTGAPAVTITRMRRGRLRAGASCSSSSTICRGPPTCSARTGASRSQAATRSPLSFRLRARLRPITPRPTRPNVAEDSCEVMRLRWRKGRVGRSPRMVHAAGAWAQKLASNPNTTERPAPSMPEPWTR